MKIFKAGTEIQIKLSKQRGVITSAIVRQADVIYNVDYFVADELKECCIYEYEFDVIESNGKQTIGFK